MPTWGTVDLPPRRRGGSLTVTQQEGNARPDIVEKLVDIVRQQRAQAILSLYPSACSTHIRLNALPHWLTHPATPLEASGFIQHR